MFRQSCYVSKLFTKAIRLAGRVQIVSEYDQELPQSQTADNPMAPRGRASQPFMLSIISFFVFVFYGLLVCMF